MAHTAASLFSEEEYLLIASPPNEVYINAIAATDVQLIENQLFENVSPLHYNARIRLSIQIAEKFRKHFALIRGLMEFHRPKHFSFEYQFSQKTLEIDIEGKQLTELLIFFDLILTLITEEIRFKGALKLVLEFEDRYKKAQSEIYAQLKQPTVR